MQFGYMANHSAETANCFFLVNVTLKMDKGDVVAVLFLDHKKAFTTVNDNVLIDKLSNLNFFRESLWTEILPRRKNPVCQNPQGSIL